MTTLPEVDAYSFQSDLSLNQMHSILHVRSGLDWKGGDNDFWGEYLICRPNNSHSKLRLFIDDGRFVIDMSTLPGEKDMLSYEELQEIVEEKVLPLLKARDVQPHPGWE
jgi:hypothetical protein